LICANTLLISSFLFNPCLSPPQPAGLRNRNAAAFASYPVTDLMRAMVVILLLSVIVLKFKPLWSYAFCVHERLYPDKNLFLVQKITNVPEHGRYKEHGGHLDGFRADPAKEPGRNGYGKA